MGAAVARAVVVEVEWALAAKMLGGTITELPMEVEGLEV